MIINGSFNLVTNRNYLTDASKQILKDNSFLAQIKKFLDKAERNLPVCRELIERLNKQNQEAKLEAYVDKFKKFKKILKSEQGLKLTT